MDRYIFHLSRSCGFMCHAARQKLSRFDLCASVTVVSAQSKQTTAYPCPIVAEKRQGEDLRAPERKQYPVNADTEKTYALQDGSTIHKRWNCTEESGAKRPQGADPRLPGRKQDRYTYLVRKATRRRPTRSRKATSSISQQTTDTREEATEEKKTCELPDGNITEASQG